MHSIAILYPNIDPIITFGIAASSFCQSGGLNAGRDGFGGADTDFITVDSHEAQFGDGGRSRRGLYAGVRRSGPNLDAVGFSCLNGDR